ncbi:cytochrome P450 [Streptomyces parvulus]|uniref:cytochrome P450 n=1 Tax=Streptomyces parvulus TaxID=146923 RepID=UPI0038028867
MARTASTVRRWFMFNDGPQHRQLRRIIAPLFSAGSISGVRPYIEDLVDALLDNRHDQIDIMADVAVPLSSQVICHMLGLSPEVAPHLEGWSQDIAALLIADYLPQVVRQGDEALQNITQAVDAAMRDNALSEESGLGLLRQAHADGLISSSDITATSSLLVYAGFETTSTFIGKAVRAALHAGKWRELTHAGIETTVEELLRFDTSVQQVARVASAPIEVAGHRIDAGDLVLLMLGVANRDPNHFSAADTLDSHRGPKRHLAFGHGSHYCLGAGLARLEAQIVLRKMMTKWGHIELAESPKTRSHYGVPVLEHIRVSVHL